MKFSCLNIVRFRRNLKTSAKNIYIVKYFISLENDGSLGDDVSQTYICLMCLKMGRHHQQGRWQARIGRVAGNKDLYLGTFGKLYFLSIHYY